MGGPPSQVAYVRPFYDQEVIRFGVERVHVYRRRPVELGCLKLVFWLASALVLAGMLCLTVGAMRDKDAIAAVGGVFVGVGISFSVAARVIWFARQSTAKLRGATLVLSPSGLALSQGEMKGEMDWEELVEVTTKRPFLPAFQAAWGRAARLQLQGATEFLLDIYNRPLREIVGQMQNHMTVARQSADDSI